jgi:hypothetical protein
MLGPLCLIFALFGYSKRINNIMLYRNYKNGKTLILSESKKLIKERSYLYPTLVVQGLIKKQSLYFSPQFFSTSANLEINNLKRYFANLIKKNNKLFEGSSLIQGSSVDKEFSKSSNSCMRTTRDIIKDLEREILKTLSKLDA